MEYIYAALLLHNAGKDVSEENVTAVLNAAGVEVQDARVKALVAALEDVNIEEAISKAAVAPVAAAPAAAAPAAAAAAAEEEPEEESKKEEEEESGMARLGALFG
ncbi:MAG: 50S ribosomal protein P1 [Methanomicrobiales archaeon]|nr:50S ribosomal protein P1 [Methanomicrobiales archaeon]